MSESEPHTAHVSVSPPAGTVPVREHAFDGIQEYDNDLPRWWLWLFYLSVVWSVFYAAHYHVGSGSAAIGAAGLAAEQRALMEARAGAGGAVLSETDLRALSRSPERIARGRTLYTRSNCAQCHGPDGTGTQGAQVMAGPNLFDRFWIYGHDLTAISSVIADGRGQMPAQKHLLSPSEIADLAIWIADGVRSGGKPGKPADPVREREAPADW